MARYSRRYDETNHDEPRTLYPEHPITRQGRRCVIDIGPPVDVRIAREAAAYAALADEEAEDERRAAVLRDAGGAE